MIRGALVGVFALALALGGCGGSSGGTGQDGGGQHDGPAAADGGSGDGGSGDGGGSPDGGTLTRGHAGGATVAGGVSARSSRYRVVMSTGDSPGGGGPAASPTYKVRTGVVGATQGQQ
jgi:hypothetical protein